MADSDDDKQVSNEVKKSEPRMSVNLGESQLSEEKTELASDTDDFYSNEFLNEECLSSGSDKILDADYGIQAKETKREEDEELTLKSEEDEEKEEDSILKELLSRQKKRTKERVSVLLADSSGKDRRDSSMVKRLILAKEKRDSQLVEKSESEESVEDEDEILCDDSHFSQYLDKRFKKASEKCNEKIYVEGIRKNDEVDFEEVREQPVKSVSVVEKTVVKEKKPAKDKLGVLESLEVEEDEDSDFSDILDESDGLEEDMEDGDDEDEESGSKGILKKVGKQRRREKRKESTENYKSDSYCDVIFDSIKMYAETSKEERIKEEEGLGINVEPEEEIGREESKEQEEKEEIIERGPANMKYRLIIEPPDEEEKEFVAEEEEEEEEEEEIYIYEEIVSRPVLTENTTLPEDALSFIYSYGYNCQKRFNLLVADEENLIFASGNLIHIFDINTRTFTFKRTIGGCGIGHIARNYTNNHIAIGEKGENPYLLIYQWPAFEILTVLKGGAEKEYVHLHYREDGEYLASQSGEPDFLITIWNWKKKKILLQVKSHGQDVFCVEFSRFVEGSLTTGGLGHIKFWKMAKTFTGLKLQGELGKFGKVNICDITGFYAMPDEKVVSGSDWGNILVWDEGLIKFQVERKLEKIAERHSLEEGSDYCSSQDTLYLSRDDAEDTPSQQFDKKSSVTSEASPKKPQSITDIPKRKEMNLKQIFDKMQRQRYIPKRVPVLVESTEELTSISPAAYKETLKIGDAKLTKRNTRGDETNQTHEREDGEEMEGKLEGTFGLEKRTDEQEVKFVERKSIVWEEENENKEMLGKGSKQNFNIKQTTNLYHDDSVRDSKWQNIECAEISGSESSLSLGDEEEAVVEERNEKKCEECVEMEEESCEDSLNEFEDIDSREKLIAAHLIEKTESDLEEVKVTDQEDKVAMESITSIPVFHESCHNAPISQFSYNHKDGYLQTIGLDGYVKTWYYKYINDQDPSEDNPFVYIEPSYELLIEDNISRASLLSYTKINTDEENYKWFLQDNNGGIWKANVAINPDVPKPERLYSCHSGPIICMVTSPVGNYLATSDSDGWLFIYNMDSKNLMMQKKFVYPIQSLIWLSEKVDNRGNSLVAGHDDGKIFILAVSILEYETRETKEIKDKSNEEEKDYLSITFRIKSHTKAVRVLSTNHLGNLLVSGSDDCTVFVHEVTLDVNISLLPIGFIRVSGPVTWINEKFDENSTFLVCCKDGCFLEAFFPDKHPEVDPVSYELNVKIVQNKFRSVKSELRRQAELDKIEEKKKAKISRKKGELAKIKAENPGLDIDEEMYLVDSEEDIEFPPLFYPEEPSPILFAYYYGKNSICLSMGGYDTGYFYKYNIDKPDPIKCAEIPGVGDYEVSSFTMFKPKDLVAFGLGNGKIRLTEKETESISNTTMYWELAMHDNDYGKITNVCLSHDQKYLYTGGADGNIFSFDVNLPKYHLPTKSLMYLHGLPETTMIDSFEPELSLEEKRQNVANEEKMATVEENKKTMRKRLKKLRMKLNRVLKINNRLPSHYQLKGDDLEVDPRITKLTTDTIIEKMNQLNRMYEYKLEKSQLAYQKLYDYFIEPVATFRTTVSSIRKQVSASTFVHTKLSFLFQEAQNYLTLKNDKYEDKGRLDKHAFTKGEQDGKQKKPTPLVPWLRGISTFCDKLDPKTLRALDSYYERHKAEEQRKNEWESFLAAKPDINRMDGRDLASIDAAIRNIGDYKLKTSKEFRVPKSQRITVKQKYTQLLVTRRKIYEIKSSYNKKVIELRDEKVEMVKRFKKLYQVLKKVHAELPENWSKEPPSIPEINIDEEFPERKFQIDPEPFPFEEISDDEAQDEEKYMLHPHLLKFNVPYTSVLNEQSTSRELDLRNRRRRKKKQHQEDILRELDDLVINFDKRLETLHIDQLKVSIVCKLLEIHLLSVHQELAVTKSYEKLENEVTEKVFKMTSLKLYYKLKINCGKNKLAGYLKDIIAYQEKDKEIHRSFQDMIAENKYADFLTKIFKKKYKPPKIREEGASESSSSSSESSDEEEGDFDDDDDEGELDVLKLDFNICPEDLEKDIYDKTFALRKERYETELAVQDLKKQTEIMKKEVDVHTKKIKTIEVILAVHFLCMEKLQVKKQGQLNKIEIAVILRTKQLQHINPRNLYEPLDETIVFPKSTLIKLNERVAELDKETQEEILKHQKYKTHLKRMNIDLKKMEEQIEGLKKKIESEMICRFGCIINVGLMEDMILKKMILEKRYKVDNFNQAINREVAEFKLQILERGEQLAAVQRVNTEKLHLLCALEEEKGKVAQLVDKQLRKRNRLPERKKLEEELKADVNKFTSIFKDLVSQKQKLQKEIKSLSLKGRPLPPIPKKRGRLPSVLYDRSVPYEQKTEEKELFKNIKYDEMFEDGAILPSREDSYFNIYMEKVQSEKGKKEKLGEKAKQVEVSEAFTLKTKSKVEEEISSELLSHIIDENQKSAPDKFGTKELLKKDEYLEKCKEAEQRSEIIVEEAIDRAIATITKQYVTDIIEKAIDKIPKQRIAEGMRNLIDEIVKDAVKDTSGTEPLSEEKYIKTEKEEEEETLQDEITGVNEDIQILREDNFQDKDEQENIP